MRGLSIAYFVVVHPVVRAHGINSVVAAQVGSPDGEVVYLEVDPKVEDEVELGAVDQEEVVDRGVDGRDQAD